MVTPPSGGTRPVAVVVGPPGSGKTVTGAALAAALGVPFHDVDEAIVRSGGRSISDIFVDDGEVAFRALERAEVARALAEETGVVSLGGGAPMDPASQELLRSHRVVFLDVGIADAARRIGFDTSRPLLSVNPRGSWIAMMKARRPVYESLGAIRVDTAGRTPDEVAAEAATLLGALGVSGVSGVSGASGESAVTRIPVGDDYDVLVGRGLLADPAAVVELLPPGAERVLVVHAGLLAEAARTLGAALTAAGHAAYLEAVPDGEVAKTAAEAARLWGVLGRAGFTRTDAVVGLGGGSVTDLAGFVAATWLRGVSVVQVPTTLLGMVDAAVGGKTGINTAEGKNLVGAFHPPVGVLCDLDLLASLPMADLAAGMAEIVKAGFIADPEILEIVELDGASEGFAVAGADWPPLRELVERAVRVKAEVVAADLRESSLREILNYGHTFAHAVELVESFTWRHGEAVAVGMVYVAELARLAGVLDASVVERHRAVLTSLGLPTTYRGDRWDELLTAMRRDKKARGSLLRFVVLHGIGDPQRLEGPSEDLLRAAYAAVSG